MKKENKKMAQEKRAMERQKKEQQTKVKGILTIAIPAVIIIVLLVWIISDAVKSSGSGDTEIAAGTEATETENAVIDDTDTDDADDTLYLTEDETEGSELYTGTDIAVEDGDIVNIDYVGYVDGEAFAGGDTQGYGTDLAIGSGSYIDDFEEQLIGHYVGETVDVVVTFPDPYLNNEDLSGKEATFVTVINGIYK